MTTQVEARLVLAELIQLSYAQDEGLTAAIVKSGHSYRLQVNPDGSARLTGSMGAVRFSGQEALDSFGVKIKKVSVTFTNGEGGLVYYKGSYFLLLGSFNVSGSFDIFKLAKSCSGLFCTAARLLSGRREQIDQALEF